MAAAEGRARRSVPATQDNRLPEHRPGDPLPVVTRVTCLGCRRIYFTTVSVALALAVGRSDCCGSPTEVLDAEPGPS
jgi:hypothetical protein